MKLFKVSKKALDQYRDTVRDNKHVSQELAQKKLTRNIMLVKETAPHRIEKGFLTVTYKYGNLFITTLGNIVVRVVNHKGKPLKWRFPKERYIQLSEQLEIEDSKFKSKKIVNT